jgi:hypothetical protein
MIEGRAGIAGKAATSKEQIETVFLHHDMTDPEIRSAFKRRGERFEKILKSDKRKFFLMCKLVRSEAAAKRAKEIENRHFKEMFETLVKQDCTNFDMVGINLICLKASKRNGGRDPKAELLKNLSCTAGDCSLKAFDFHCIGDAYGSVYEDKDVKGLCKLIHGGRKFDLSSDPLKDETSSGPGASRKRVCANSSATTKKKPKTGVPDSHAKGSSAKA